MATKLTLKGGDATASVRKPEGRLYRHDVEGFYVEVTRETNGQLMMESGTPMGTAIHVPISRMTLELMLESVKLDEEERGE